MTSLITLKRANTAPPRGICDVHPLRHALSGNQGGLVGLLLRSVRTPFGQSGSLCDLELVPPKWRCLVPGERRDGAQSRPPGGNAHRWAAYAMIQIYY